MKKILLIIFVWIVAVYVVAECLPGEDQKEEPIPEQTQEEICRSTYYKDELTLRPSKEELIKQCEQFCTISKCQMKHANIGDISGASKSFYRVCVCE